MSFVALVYADLLVTLLAVGHGFNELNPLMASLLGRPGELFLVKFAPPLFIAWLVPGRLLLPSIGALLLLSAWNIGALLTLW